MHVSEFAKKRRKELGLTQDQLAWKAGVSHSIIQRLESGRAFNCRGNTLFLIMKAYDLSPKEEREFSDLELGETNWQRSRRILSEKCQQQGKQSKELLKQLMDLLEKQKSGVPN